MILKAIGHKRGSASFLRMRMRVIRSSHVRARVVLRDTSELRELGMRMGGGREIHAPRAGDVQRVLIGDRL